MKQGLLRGETIWHILSIILTFVLNFIIMLFFWDVFRQLGEIAGLGDTYPFFKTGMYRGLNEIEIAALSVLLPTLLTVLPFMPMLLMILCGGYPPKPDEENYLRAVLGEICRRNGQDPDEFVLGVIPEERNAFAIGKKHLAIGRPLIQGMRAEALMGIMAHEMGHLQYGHTWLMLVMMGMQISTRLAYMGFNLLFMVTNVFLTVCRALSYIPFVSIFAVCVSWMVALIIYVIRMWEYPKFCVNS